MNFSFYSGAVGAMSHSKRLEVIANNISNTNTNGFKAKNGVFTDLVYKNMNAPDGAQTQLTYGAGVKMLKDDTDFVQGALELTGFSLDYAINGPGFFALREPATGEITYTRDGAFSTSQQPNGQFYLVSKNNKWVLDANGNPIVVENPSDNIGIGVYVFEQKNGLLNIGDNEYQPVEKNGVPRALDGYRAGVIVKGALEGSNVDFAKEMTKVIETQRAYQMSLKMAQTSDEIENTINSLR